MSITHKLRRNMFSESSLVFHYNKFNLISENYLAQELCRPRLKRNVFPSNKINPPKTHFVSHQPIFVAACINLPVPYNQSIRTYKKLNCQPFWNREIVVVEMSTKK